MTQVASIGLDIAKNVFQVYAADTSGNPLFNRKISRSSLLVLQKARTVCRGNGVLLHQPSLGSLDW